MSLTCIALPNIEPITLIEVKNYLHLEHDSEDELIGHLIAVARQSIEAYTNLCLIEQTWQIVVSYDYCLKISDHHYLSHNYSRGCRGLHLPKAPFIEIVGKPMITNGQQQVAVHQFRIDPSEQFARLHVASMHHGINDTASQLSVSFKVGYGAQAACIPPSLKQATLVLTAQLYENRLGVIDKNIGLQEIMNQSVINLIKPYQSRRLI